LLRHEKLAFWKFFSIYFGSVALLILTSGYFYFQEQKKSLIEKEHFSMIEYTRQLKMKMNPHSEHITHKRTSLELENFNMDNFTIKEDSFEKFMPYSWEGGLILVTKDKVHYEEALGLVKIEIIILQVSLLFLFAIISYFLAIQALLPMKNAIEKLDNFSKDLIHDLNTPVTSILLNLKILESHKELGEIKALSRLKQSAKDISQLHKNLTHLLYEDTMIISSEAIFEIVDEVLEPYKKIYANLDFYVEYAYFEADVNREAFKQVLTNLISNACKYNSENGYVKIYKNENSLYIEDRGVGIQNIEHVFKRSYTEHADGHGLGLDIVQKLCKAMSIEVGVVSNSSQGSTFFLNFHA